MYTEYNVVTKLIEYVNPLINNVIALLPVTYRHISLAQEARCDLSYNQGYRDALITIKTKLEIDQQEYEDNLPKPEDFQQSTKKESKDDDR